MENSKKKFESVIFDFCRLLDWGQNHLQIGDFDVIVDNLTDIYNKYLRYENIMTYCIKNLNTEEKQPMFDIAKKYEDKLKLDFKYNVSDITEIT